jgi:hypothetical protein
MHLSYKEFELDLPKFRWFLRDQQVQAKQHLRRLCFSTLEYRESGAEFDSNEDVATIAESTSTAKQIHQTRLPRVHLRDLKDNPACSTTRWNFLLDERNSQLHGYQRLLLNRCSTRPSVKKQFITNKHGDGIRWKRQRVKEYLRDVDSFLRRLLLLIHITGGQPARSTELLTIRWCNSSDGLRRSIFMENGLIYMVTSCLKGYSITGSTKIIHRYLPPKISELVVYYLWLVVLFC